MTKVDEHHITGKDYEPLKKRYEKAVKDKETSFFYTTVKGVRIEVSTGYVKYLLMYIEQKYGINP